MNINKKLSSTLSSLIASLTVAACSSGNVPLATDLKGNVNFNKSNIVIGPADLVSKAGDFTAIQKPNGDVNYVVDVGHGIKTGASLTVKLDLHEGFKTKAFLDGARAAVKDDIRGVEFYLLNVNVPQAGSTGQSPATPLVVGAGTSNTIAGPLFLDDAAGKIGTGGATGIRATGTASITFSNLAPDAVNASSGKTDIFVLAAAQNVSTLAAITSTPSTNITNKKFISGTSLFLQDNSGSLSPNFVRGWYNVSNSGGDQTTAPTNIGRINVTNGSISATPYLIANRATAAALVVPLTLMDAVGAAIDSTVNVTDGSATPTFGPKVQ